MYEIRALYPDAMAADLAYRRQQLLGNRTTVSSRRPRRRTRRHDGR